MMLKKSPRVGWAVFLGVLWLLAACTALPETTEPVTLPTGTTLPATETQPKESPTLNPTASHAPKSTQTPPEPINPVHPEPTITPHPIEQVVRDPVERAVEDLAQRLGISESEIKVVNEYGDDFVGDNLGCPGGKTPLRPLQVLVTGRVIELQADGQIYIYHAHGADLVYCSGD